MIPCFWWESCKKRPQKEEIKLLELFLGPSASLPACRRTLWCQHPGDVYDVSTPKQRFLQHCRAVEQKELGHPGCFWLCVGCGQFCSISHVMQWGRMARAG